jgi:plastocyanin
MLLVAVAALALLFAGSTQATQTSVKKLYGTVGPGFTIKLKNAAGKPVRKVRAGRYTFVIRDKSGIHNFHLRGMGVDKKTGVAFTGKKTWRSLRLKKGKTYKFRCDPHRATMHGSFKVT